MWLALFSLSLAAPVPEATWFDPGPGPRVCVSSVPGAGKLKGRDKNSFVGLLDRLRSAEGDQPALEALLAEVTAEVADWREHPAGPALVEVVALLAGEPREALFELAEANPRDGCLQASGAAAALALRSPDKSTREMLGRAWIGTRHPDVAWMLAEVVRQEGDLDRAAQLADRALRQEPDHLGLNRLRTGIAIARGETEAVLPELERLRAAGDHSFDEALMMGYYRAGRVGDYLRIADELGAPLGAARGISSEADPEAAYRERLGIGAAGAQLLVSLQTSMGTMKCVLYPETAPVTVANFVGLAKGDQPWTDPRSEERMESPLYDGTVLHRVIPDFMIQAGDPLGVGSGGPGYEFHDEVTSTLRFDRRGRLAMANAGPGTNGSQFFVTAAPVSHLDGRHTIFGQCSGDDVVDKIASVNRDPRDRPYVEIVLERVLVEAIQPVAPPGH